MSNGYNHARTLVSAWDTQSRSHVQHPQLTPLNFLKNQESSQVVYLRYCAFTTLSFGVAVEPYSCFQKFGEKMVNYPQFAKYPPPME